MWLLIQVVAVILAIVAYRRTARIDALERRIVALARDLAALRGTSPAAEAGAPGETPRPAPETAAPDESARPVDAPSAEHQPPPPPAEPPPPAPPPLVARQPPPPDLGPSLAARAAGAFGDLRDRIDLEQMIGQRAAPLVAAVALGLAGLMFFKYSIEHGLFPPWSRVVVGTIVGLAAVVSSERLRGRDYALTANGLAAGGLVVLYAACWAAGVRYELIPNALAFALMIATTAAGCALSWRHRSEAIAIIGLVGGFATPVLLSTGQDRPIGLFGYVLLLDLGLLYLARARGWRRLVLLSFAATVFFEAYWIFTRLDPARLWIGLGIAATFGLLFAFADDERAGVEGKSRASVHAAAVLVPFAFALYFAGRAELGPAPWPIALLLVVLSAAAGWLARIHDEPALGTAAVAASLAVLGVWLARHDLTAGTAWQLAAGVLALGAVAHAYVEVDREPARRLPDGPGLAAVLGTFGGMALVLLAIDRSPVTPWPWHLATAGLTALAVRHGVRPQRLPLLAAAGFAVALVVVSLHAWMTREGMASARILPLAWAVGFQLVALTRRDASVRAAADHGAAAHAALLALGLTGALTSSVWDPALALALGALVLLAAARLGSGLWLAGAVAATAWVHTVWSHQSGIGAATQAWGLMLGFGAVVLMTAWPLLAGRAFATDRTAWRAAALSGAAFFVALRHLWIARFGGDAIGLLPVLLAAIVLAVAAGARSRWPADSPMWTSSMAWLSAAALALLALAVPLQLEREWITIGWALQGLAVLVIWTRIDHPGLKYFGVALLLASTLRLVANPAVLGYYPRSSWRVVNWLAYTYLVPAAALVAAARLLAERERERLRDWERGRLYAYPYPTAAVACGLSALLVVFVWINLAIADWFSTGPSLRVSFGSMPARDLATSIAWALYALVLLALGVARTSAALRWTSLALLVVTIAKVFLHDLGELRDLYRVASLVGLAISLFLVSAAYQRFVFRREPSAEAPS